MGRTRGGRVRASPPFCESITRSRWVGSCYSGASTPSPAGLLCVQWTGESCLSALPTALLAPQPFFCRRLGLFGTTARLPLRPGPTGASRLLPLPAAARVGRSCRGREAARVFRAWRPRSPTLPAALPVSGLPAARPERTRRPRGPSRFPSGPRAHAPLFARPCGPSGSPYFLRAPGVAFTAPRRAPTRACAVLRGVQASVRVRGLSRRADSALGLPRPWPSRARPGDARPPARKGAGSPWSPPSPSWGSPQRTVARPCSAQVLGDGLGRDPRAPFVPVCGGAPVRQFLKQELTPPGEELPGSKSRGATHVGWNDQTGPRVFQQCSRPGGRPPPKGRPDTKLWGLCVSRKREKWAVRQLPELLILCVLRHHRSLTSEVTEVRFTLTPRLRAKPQSCILLAET